MDMKKSRKSIEDKSWARANEIPYTFEDQPPEPNWVTASEVTRANREFRSLEAQKSSDIPYEKKKKSSKNLDNKGDKSSSSPRKYNDAVPEPTKSTSHKKKSSKYDDQEKTPEKKHSKKSDRHRSKSSSEDGEEVLKNQLANIKIKDSKSKFSHKTYRNVKSSDIRSSLKPLESNLARKPSFNSPDNDDLPHKTYPKEIHPSMMPLKPKNKHSGYQNSYNNSSAEEIDDSTGDSDEEISEKPYNSRVKNHQKSYPSKESARPYNDTRGNSITKTTSKGNINDPDSHRHQDLARNKSYGGWGSEGQPPQRKRSEDNAYSRNSTPDLVGHDYGKHLSKQRSRDMYYDQHIDNHYRRDNTTSPDQFGGREPGSGQYRGNDPSPPDYHRKRKPNPSNEHGSPDRYRSHIQASNPHNYYEPSPDGHIINDSIPYMAKEPSTRHHIPYKTNEPSLDHYKHHDSVPYGNHESPSDHNSARKPPTQSHQNKYPQKEFYDESYRSPEMYEPLGYQRRNPEQYNHLDDIPNSQFYKHPEVTPNPNYYNHPDVPASYGGQGAMRGGPRDIIPHDYRDTRASADRSREHRY